jgi:hypothetical protein
MCCATLMDRLKTEWPVAYINDNLAMIDAWAQRSQSLD